MTLGAAGCKAGLAPTPKCPRTLATIQESSLNPGASFLRRNVGPSLLTFKLNGFCASTDFAVRVFPVVHRGCRGNEASSAVLSIKITLTTKQTLHTASPQPTHPPLHHQLHHQNSINRARRKRDGDDGILVTATTAILQASDQV